MVYNVLTPRSRHTLPGLAGLPARHACLHHMSKTYGQKVFHASNPARGKGLARPPDRPSLLGKRVGDQAGSRR